MRQLRVIDLYCGGGGTSEGMRRAFTRAKRDYTLMAVNHWPRAIETHSANHPHAKHLCASVDQVISTDHSAPGIDILWASPSCTHHSRARGGKPVDDQQRASAFCVLRWVEEQRPSVLFVENVPEFLDWGPLGYNGRPLKSKKGELFKQWVAMLRTLGYKVDWRVLCAADYGAPTTRRRLFVQAVRGQRKIIWPEPTHAPTDAPADLFRVKRAPWRPAREIIDWEIPGKSIFGRKKPLCEKTLRRIWAGLEKFCFAGPVLRQDEQDLQDGKGTNAEPGTLNVERSTSPNATYPVGIGRDVPASVIDAAFPEEPSRPREALPFVQPCLVNLRGGTDSHVTTSARSVDQPLGTVTANGKHAALVKPYLVQVSHGGEHGGRQKSLDEPLPTVATSGHWALAQPFLVNQHGTSDQQVAGSARSLDDPLGSIAGCGHDCLVTPALKPFVIGQQGGAAPRSVDEPLPTVATAGVVRLAQPYLVQVSHGGERSGRTKSLDEPLATVTGNRGEWSLIEPKPFLIQTDRPNEKGKGQNVKLPGTDGGINPFLVQFYGTGGASDVNDPLSTITTKDRFGLVMPIVEVNGQRYQLDIHFRMLDWRELARGQGFQDAYAFKGTKTEKVKQIGNAVPPDFAEALANAHLHQL